MCVSNHPRQRINDRLRAKSSLKKVRIGNQCLFKGYASVLFETKTETFAVNWLPMVSSFPHFLNFLITVTLTPLSQSITTACLSHSFINSAPLFSRTSCPPAAALFLEIYFSFSPLTFLLTTVTVPPYTIQTSPLSNSFVWGSCPNSITQATK